jgi:hypothetical protein
MDKKLIEYFDEVPDWGSFKVLGDEYSAYIPVAKVSGWKQFTEILEDEFFNRPTTQLSFRGHRRYDWGLTPSLGRLNTSGIISEELADSQVELFRRATRGRLTDTSMVDDGEADELWSVGQHHGLMTPLLDWTYSPYVALFFAFVKDNQKHESDNPYRVVYVLNKSYIANDSVCPEIRIVEPRKDEYGRLVNQAGLFTFSPYDKAIENALIESLQDAEGLEGLFDVDGESDAQELANYICKIYIANEDRDGCLRHLRRMNVHHASLFPDLLGASDYCNILVEEENTIRKTEEAQNEGRVVTPEPIEIKIIIPPPTVELSGGEELGLEALLKKSDGGDQVEPGRIKIIASELALEIRRLQVVDWEDREPVQARMRNMARSILRKYGFPVSAREELINRVLVAAKMVEEDKDD